MKRYFVYDPEVGFATYPTEADALKAAEEAIQGYLDEENAWIETVERVFVGTITHKSEQFNAAERPAPEDLDGGFDKDGNYWPPGRDAAGLRVKRLKIEEGSDDKSDQRL